MDTSNSRPTPTPPSGEPTVDTVDWKTQLPPGSRGRIVSKMHLPFSGQEGLNELRDIAVNFEEKIFAVASSQSDYLRRICLKMLAVESERQTVCITANRKRVMAPPH